MLEEVWGWASPAIVARRENNKHPKLVPFSRARQKSHHPKVKEEVVMQMLKSKRRQGAAQWLKGADRTRSPPGRRQAQRRQRKQGDSGG